MTDAELMNYALGRNEDPQLRLALARDKRIRDRLAQLEAGLLEDRLQNQASYGFALEAQAQEAPDTASSPKKSRRQR